MSYENLVAKGDPQIGGQNLDLLLYPQADSDEDEARNEVASAIESAADQMLNENNFDSYEINLYEGTTDVKTDDKSDTADTYFNNFKDWIANNTSRRGVHLGVTGHTNFASAEAIGKGESAWVASTRAFVGTSGDYDISVNGTERYKNLAVQEPIHNMVVSDYSYVSDMTDGDEHDLGKITSGGDSTPMLTFYERDDTHPSRSHDRSEKGDCQTIATWDNTHTRTVTYCTQMAVDYTADQEV